MASYLAFTVDEVTLNGAENGLEISGSGERIGGAIGEASEEALQILRFRILQKSKETIWQADSSA